MTHSAFLQNADPPSAARVEALLARAAELDQHDREGARRALLEAVALAVSLRDATLSGRCLLQLATLEWRLSEHASATQHASEALAHFRAVEDRAHEAWSLRLLGNIHGVQSQYVPASEYLQAAAALSREIRDRSCLASCLNNLGIIAHELGDYATALEHLFEALRTYDVGHQHIPSTLNNVASLYQQLGQHERALPYHQETLALSRAEAGHPLLATFLHNMAETLRQLDRHAEALPLLQDALALARQISDYQTEMLTLDSLGQTHQALGDIALARECYAAGLEVAGRVNHPLPEVKLRMHHAALQPHDARAMLEQALALAEATGLRAEALEVHDLLVAACRQTGALDVALAHSEAARRLERELFNEAQDRRAQAAQIQHDVVRAREVAEAQQALNEQLRRANEELDAFSYSISHDLRAPVRHIAGFAGLLRRSLEGHSNPQTHRYLGVIEQAAGRLNTLIDVMLSFARQSREPLRIQAVDLNTLVAEVRADLMPEQQGRRVVWQVSALPQVQGDPALLRQVLVNLLSNALKYSQRREEASIEVWAERQAAEWVVHVRDNGAGFDPAYADKLFGVFQRLHRAEEFEGIGVGLASVQRIVARHGGRVWAASQLGQGATFSFALPA